MSSKVRFLAGLKFARDFSRQVLSEFQADEDWLLMPHDQAKHALWFAGHMGVADNSAIGVLAPESSLRIPDYQRMFGMGSSPSTEAADYPPPDEVLSFMNERRRTLLKLIDGLTEDDLTAPTPDTAPPFLPDVGSVLQFLAWHEGLHVGQITLAHRVLGHTPIATREELYSGASAS